jgi:hypothetical protein
MNLLTILGILVIVIILAVFIFGAYISKNFFPDWKKIEANTLCFIGDQMAAPFVSPGIFESLLFAGIFTLIAILFTISSKNRIIKIIVPTAIFVASFGILYIIGVMFPAILVPMFSGDDMAFATIIVGGLTWLILFPLLKEKKAALVGMILLLWFILFLGYKYSGIYMARYAENMGKLQNSSVMDGYPTQCCSTASCQVIQLPTLSENGAVVYKPLTFGSFSPTWIIGSIVGLFGLIILIVSVIKIRKGDKVKK